MKKIFFINAFIFIACFSFSQEAMKIQSGGSITIQNGAELVLQGGLTLDDGSSLLNNGTISLKNNTVSNISNWTDNSIPGALTGTGIVIFNSTHAQQFTGPTSFYTVYINTDQLSINNDLGISNLLRLIKGRINTANYVVALVNMATSSLENDPTNSGYANSWINGNFKRSIATNTSTYDFPVGTGTRSNLLQFVNNNISGTQYLSASFGAKPGTDDGLNATENGFRYTAVNDGGVWYLAPDAIPSAGTYSLHLYFNEFTGLTDNRFGILRRPDGSTNAADWLVPVGSSLEPDNGPGRTVSDGYARRNDISDFSQWGIGIMGSCITSTFYLDGDGDGYGDPNQTTQDCTVPAGYVSNNADCDDSKLLYTDTDGDGFGAGVPVACGVISNTDCNDNDPAINPNTIWYLDADNDNYYTGSGLTQCVSPGTGYKISGLIAGGDCNDNNANVNPGRLEQCGNNIDDNCNGQINEGCPVTISINDVTVYESQGQAVPTVSLSKPATTGIKVNFKTIDGTALKPKDYKNTNGSISIPAGSLSGLITIPIIQDNVTEGPEYFDVQISLPKISGQPQTAIVNDDLGRVTILNGSAPLLTRPSTTFTDSTKVNNTAGFDVAVTPNPSESDFIIHILGSSNEPADIRVFDVQGRMVKQLRSISTNVRFGSDLRSGIYLVEVKQAVFRRSLKLVKL